MSKNGTAFRPRTKASPEQMRYLARYMAKNPKMISGVGYTLDERVQVEAAWKKLVAHLNSMQGSSKSVAKWKQAWRDMRSNARKKESLNEMKDDEPDDSGIKKAVVAVKIENLDDPFETVNCLEDDSSDSESLNELDEEQIQNIIQDSRESTGMPANSYNETADKDSSAQAKRNITEDQQRQQKELHDINLKILNEKLIFTKTMNAIELEHQRKIKDLELRFLNEKYELELNLLKNRNNY